MTNTQMQKVIAGVAIAVSAAIGGAYALPSVSSDNRDDTRERLVRVEEKLDALAERVAELKSDLRDFQSAQ